MVVIARLAVDRTEQGPGLGTRLLADAYGTLDRLLKAGLVAVVGEEIVDGRARRYYPSPTLSARCTTRPCAPAKLRA